MKSLKLSTLEGYHHLLTSDTTGSRSEWKELAALLTTGETYFFRDRGQFSLLRNFILPAIIEKKRPTQTLRIWSAGCSSGEEAYSTAILLNEILSKLKAWDIYVLGTDINEQAVEKAKKAYTASGLFA